MIESPDFGEIQAQRKEMAERTLRGATVEEVSAILENIFHDNSSHPWAGRAADFVAEHKTDTALMADLPDGYAVIFYPKQGKGLWFKHTGRLEAVGMLQPSALEKLGELARTKSLI